MTSQMTSVYLVMIIGTIIHIAAIYAVVALDLRTGPEGGYQ